MIQLKSVSLRRGTQLLLEDADLTLLPGQRLGLVGKNGTGKSSLLAMFEGEIAPDAGDIEWAGGQRMATVEQETPALDASAVDYVLDGDRDYARLNAALLEAEAENDGMRMAEIYPEFETIGGFSARARAARLLDGLGFAPASIDNPVSSFSGGWRMRLNLARALIAPSDILLLDEPTNHLDLDAVFWLADWLVSYPGTLIVVSHDRDFLDHVCTHIAHIENQSLNLYTGHYSSFEEMRAERLMQNQALAAKMAKERERLQGFIDRFRAQATKARAAQSRVKALERLPVIAASHADRDDFSFYFPSPKRAPDPMVTLEGVSIGYDGTPLIEDVSLQIRAGDRIGVLGANGAGKTTLIRVIADGGETWLSGDRFVAPGVQVGYYTQHQLDQLDPRDTPLIALERVAGKTASTQKLRDFLGRFGFVGDRIFEPIEPFSGGEKARLALALLVWKAPNLLILDEPTNHLDLAMREALAEALQTFEGAILVVSHDKSLIELVCDRFWWVRGGAALPFDGDLDDYREAVTERRRAHNREQAADKPGQKAAQKSDKKAGKKAPAAPANASSDWGKPRDKASRAQAKERQKRLDRLEAEVQRLGEQLAEIDTALADPALYEGQREDGVVRLQGERGEIGVRLEAAETAWLEAQEDG
ncbi:ribosomal protection-like ABC-F family protein [Guyparkeria halopsychrophila]|uniref:ribosomal protection-like ABC-F family protein n=1 Tax=Guyparkeria halopsychrophila TaxID=3139421 RepID=UPI0037C921C4